MCRENSIEKKKKNQTGLWPNVMTLGDYGFTHWPTT